MALLTKADLKTHIYPEIRDLITRSDDSIIDKAIARGEAQAKVYLNKYNLSAMFVGTFQDELLRGICTDLVCWQLIKLANPNINLELFRTGYEDAIKELEKIQKGLTAPDWPLRSDDPATPLDEAGAIGWDSNKKRKNHY